MATYLVKHLLVKGAHNFYGHYLEKAAHSPLMQKIFYFRDQCSFSSNVRFLLHRGIETVRLTTY